MGNQQSASSSSSSSRRRSGSASKADSAKKAMNDMQSNFRQTMRKLEDSALLEQMCGPLFDDEKLRSQRSTSYAYSEDMSEEDSRTISEDGMFDDYVPESSRRRSRRSESSSNNNKKKSNEIKNDNSSSFLSQQSDFTDPKHKSKSSFETSEDESYHHTQQAQERRGKDAFTEKTSAAGSGQLAKPLASSFAKRCYFTKAGIGKTTQHYEGLTLTGNVVIMLAAAMKLKGCPTICDEDLRRVEQTYPNQFSRLPDELLLSSGWRRISKYCHFSNKPIPDGVPFFHSKKRSHPSGGYYFLIASAVGMIRPLDVEPLTRDTLVLLETDYPSQCDAVPSVLIQDPTEWTLVDKFCFFSGGPINTKEDVFYRADFDGNSIFMLAFLSPSLTPEDLYKLTIDASDEPGIKSVREVEEVESVYDLTEQDFEDLKLYHLGPCRALPPYVIRPQAWTKVLPPHFVAARQRALMRAQRWEEKHGLATKSATPTDTGSVAPVQPSSVAPTTNATVQGDQLSVAASSSATGPMMQQQQQQQEMHTQPNYQYEQQPYYPQQPGQWQGQQRHFPGQPQPAMVSQQNSMHGPSTPGRPPSHQSLQMPSLQPQGSSAYYPHALQHQAPSSTRSSSPTIQSQGMGGFASSYISPPSQQEHPSYFDSSLVQRADSHVSNQDFQRQVEEEGAFDNSAPLDEAIAQRNRSQQQQQAQPPGWRQGSQRTTKLDPPDDEPPSLSNEDRHRNSYDKDPRPTSHYDDVNRTSDAGYDQPPLEYDQPPLEYDQPPLEYDQPDPLPYSHEDSDKVKNNDAEAVHEKEPDPYGQSAQGPYDQPAPAPYDQSAPVLYDTSPTPYDHAAPVAYEEPSPSPYSRPSAAPYDHPSMYDQPEYGAEPGYGPEPNYGPQSNYGSESDYRNEAGYDQGPYGGEQLDETRFSEQAIDGQPYDGQAYDGQVHERQAYDGQAYDGQAYDSQAYGDRPYDQAYNQSYNASPRSQYYDRQDANNYPNARDGYMDEEVQQYSPNKPHRDYEGQPYFSAEGPGYAEEMEAKEDYAREDEYYSSPGPGQKGSYEMRDNGHYNDGYSQSRDTKSYVLRDEQSCAASRGSEYDGSLTHNRSPAASRRWSDNNSVYSYERSKADDHSAYESRTESRAYSNGHSPRNGQSFHDRSRTDEHSTHTSRTGDNTTYASRVDRSTYESHADRSAYGSRAGNDKEHREQSSHTLPDKSTAYQGDCGSAEYSEARRDFEESPNKNRTRSTDEQESPMKNSVVGSDYTVASSMVRSAQDLLKKNRQKRQNSQKKNEGALSSNSALSPQSDRSESTWESASERTSVVSGSSVWTDGSAGGSRSTRRSLILQMAKARMKSSGGKSSSGMTIHSEDKTKVPIAEEPEYLEAPDFSGELD